METDIDRDDNPVDCNDESWTDIYDRMEDAEDFINHDHSMDY